MTSADSTAAQPSEIELTDEELQQYLDVIHNDSLSESQVLEELEKLPDRIRQGGSQLVLGLLAPRDAT